MSNLNKRVLAAALAAVIASPAAFAATVTVTGASVQALEVTGATLPAAETQAAVAYTLQAGDILVGRQESSGNVNIRVNLSGASFNGAPTVAIAAGQDVGTTIVGAPVLSGGVLSFVIKPTAVAGGLVAGDLFTIAAGMSLSDATAIKTAGAPGVTLTVDARDVTSGNTLQAATTATSILTSQQATLLTWTGGGSFTADVTATPGKAKFINSPTNANFISTTLVNLGRLVVNIPTPRSAAGSGVTDNDSNGALAGGNFQFDVLPAGATTTVDRVAFTVTFTDSAAFGASGVFVDADATCDGGVNSVTLTRASNTYTGNYDLTSAAGGTFYVCGQVDGTTPIEQQTITASAQVDLRNTNTVDPAAVSTTSLATIGFNGTSLNVFHINPPTNLAQESYIRVINRSSTGGKVTITGRCDNNVASSTNVEFQLAAGNAVQLSSSDLENGSTKTNNTKLTFTGCTGKRRINVTGEFSPMSVQNFLRNVGDTVNTNINLDN